jgi:hypothetical protein
MNDDDLINEISLMFADAMTVRCVPSDYAKAVIAKVRVHDELRKTKELYRFIGDPRDRATVPMTLPWLGW